MFTKSHTSEIHFSHFSPLLETLNPYPYIKLTYIDYMEDSANCLPTGILSFSVTAQLLNFK